MYELALLDGILNFQTYIILGIAQLNVYILTKYKSNCFTIYNFNHQKYLLNNLRFYLTLNIMNTFIVEH